MSHWFHKLGAALGTALTLLPILGAIPGAGPVFKVATTVVGVGIALVTDLGKVLGGDAPQP
jgi:hypothetical protein